MSYNEHPNVRGVRKKINICSDKNTPSKAARNLNQVLFLYILLQCCPSLINNIYLIKTAREYLDPAKCTIMQLTVSQFPLHIIDARHHKVVLASLLSPSMSITTHTFNTHYFFKICIAFFFGVSLKIDLNVLSENTAKYVTYIYILTSCYAYSWAQVDHNFYYSTVTTQPPLCKVSISITAFKL